MQVVQEWGQVSWSTIVRLIVHQAIAARDIAITQ